MQIDVLRHGQCQGGAIFRGSIDVALSDIGWQQMQKGVARLKTDWSRIVSSPLIRCARFAEALSADTGLPLQWQNDLREICFGQWEGQSVARIWREQSHLCQAWSRAPDAHTPPGGEPFKQFRQRVLTAVNALAQEYSSQRLLLITHGGVIKLLLTEALGTGAAGMMQLNIGYGFSASLQLSQGQLTLLQPLTDGLRFNL